MTSAFACMRAGGRWCGLSVSGAQGYIHPQTGERGGGRKAGRHSLVGDKGLGSENPGED